MAFQELAPEIKSPSKVTEGSLWQADHVVPVWRGGGLCGLENLQTLCTACHSAKTKAEARERKEDPRMGGTLRFLLVIVEQWHLRSRIPIKKLQEKILISFPTKMTPLAGRKAPKAWQSKADWLEEHEGRQAHHRSQ